MRHAKDMFVCNPPLSLPACPCFSLLVIWSQAREEDINLPAHHDFDMMDCKLFSHSSFPAYT